MYTVSVLAVGNTLLIQFTRLIHAGPIVDM